MQSRDVLDTLIWATDAGHSAMVALNDWGSPGERPTQYLSDVAADDAIIEILHAEGFATLSEESGHLYSDRELTAVVDPLDGSTNAARRLPWYATSISVVDADGPWVSLVTNHVSGQAFAAVRGEGATCNSVPIAKRQPVELSNAIISLSGMAATNPGWAQFRCYGALALDLTAVAFGNFDGYIDCSVDAHGVWDYLGALHVCQELGIPVVDALGRDLVVLDHAARRTPVCGVDQPLLDQLLAARSSWQTT